MPKADDYRLLEQSDEMYITSVLLLCAKCKQPIKAWINSPQWIKCEWIGPSGECQACYNRKKDSANESKD